ncbi:hypothetical protein K1719_009364 [Acacia pycnantha]|nr:hypothetical protein K1719_009364 [Acacia pycnantha]
MLRRAVIGNGKETQRKKGCYCQTPTFMQKGRKEKKLNQYNEKRKKHVIFQPLILYFEKGKSNVFWVLS